MGKEEQEKIIRELREKAVKIEVSDKAKAADSGVAKIDKRKAWEKAKRAGKTISDDSLSAPHTAGA